MDVQQFGKFLINKSDGLITEAQITNLLLIHSQKLKNDYVRFGEMLVENKIIDDIDLNYFLYLFESEREKLKMQKRA